MEWQRTKPPEERILTFNQKARVQLPIREKQDHHVTTDWVGGRNWAILQTHTLLSNGIIHIHLASSYFKELENQVKY